MSDFIAHERTEDIPGKMSDRDTMLEFLPVDVSLDRSNTTSGHIPKRMSESQIL